MTKWVPEPPIRGAATHILTHIFFLANNSILYSKIPESRNKESNWRYAYKHSNFFHLSVYLSVYLRFSKLIIIQFNYLKFFFGFLFHRQIFKDLNRKIKVFFYAEHSYLDLAQSLLYKNDSSTNRIICTTKWNIYSKINAWTWFKLELKQFLREVKINHQWSSRCNVYEAQFICGI